MASQRSAKRIGILGHVGTENLGDEAIIAAVIQQIRDRHPAAELIAFTGVPEDTQNRHGIPAFPIRRGDRERGSSAAAQSGRFTRITDGIRAAVKAAPGLRAALKAVHKSARFLWAVLREPKFLAQSLIRLKDVDLLVFAGSNQLNDYFGGPWGFPYDLLKWCVLARCVGAKVAFLCCGAGPLRSRLGRLFVRHSLSLADYRSYRDESSRRLIDRIGVVGHDPVGVDLAYGLRPIPAPKPEPGTSRLTVGINPLPFFDERYWPEQNAAIYRSYVRKLAAFAQWLNQRGHSVVFFPTQLRADPPVIRDVEALLNGSEAPQEHPRADRPMSSLNDLMLRISMMDVVVATRYHGIVLSALLHRPVLAIAYYEKTVDLMAQLGQSEYVVDITSFDTASLTERFAAMEGRLDTIRREIERRTQALRRALDMECDRAFGLLEQASGMGAAGDQVAVLARLNGRV